MCVYTLFLIHCPLKSLFYEGFCFSNQSCVVETWTDIFFWDAGNVSETIYFLQKCCWWCVYFIFASHISASPEASQRRPSFPFLSLPQRLHLVLLRNIVIYHIVSRVRRCHLFFVPDLSSGRLDPPRDKTLSRTLEIHRAHGLVFNKQGCLDGSSLSCDLSPSLIIGEGLIRSDTAGFVLPILASWLLVE